MPNVLDAAYRPLIPVARAAELGGISRSLAYRLAAADALPGLVRLPGAQLLVRRRVLEAWLAGMDAEARAAVVSRDTAGPRQPALLSAKR